MNITNFIVTMSQNAEVETPSLFPFPFHIHMIFCCLAFVFFIIQYGKEKKPYQMIMGIAIPLSLVIWLSEGKTLFYIVGLIEVLLIAAALISSIIHNKKHGADVQEAEKEESEKAEDAASDDDEAEEQEESDTEENSGEDE